MSTLDKRATIENDGHGSLWAVFYWNNGERLKGQPFSTYESGLVELRRLSGEGKIMGQLMWLYAELRAKSGKTRSSSTHAA